MKAKIFSFILAALCSLPVLSAGGGTPADSLNGPKIAFESQTIDFGVMKANTEKEDTVMFRNVGNAPLIIKSVFSDCGCAIPSWSKSPIAPGQTGMIRVRFSSKGRLPGAFRKIIRVRSNAVNRRDVVFLEGKVARRYVK